MAQPRHSKRHAKYLFALIIMLASPALLLMWSHHASSRQTPQGKPAQAGSSTSGETITSERAGEAYGQLPLSFEVNRGQTDERVKFLSRGPGYGLFLTSGEAVLSLSGKRGEGQESGRAATVLRMKMSGANSDPQIVGQDELQAKSNYFSGTDPQKWVAGVPTYQKVLYRDLYRGVDLVYYGKGRQLEYDFVVAPRVDPGLIKLKFEGANKLEVNKDGELVLSVAGGEVRQLKPVVYQAIDGERLSVAGNYVLRGGNEVGFQLGSYDRNLPLVIDPVLSYATYLGGNNFDQAYAIAVDTSGNAYVTGTTMSSNFPTTTGAYQTTFNEGEGFVTKINAAGDALLYSTFIAGAGCNGIAVDASGNAYLTGQTGGLNFPITPGAFQTAQWGFETFITKLNATGSELVYSSRFGGDFDDFGRDIAVDASGNAYITGWTKCAAPTCAFPTVNAFQPNYGGGNNDAFVTKMNATGTALVYSTYLGGGTVLNTTDDWAEGIAVDSTGSAYVTGYTYSQDFPVTPGAYSDTTSDGLDIFVTKFSPAGSTLVYSAVFGGKGRDQGMGIALDASRNAYITGITESEDDPFTEEYDGFPVTPGAYQTTGSFDAFVTKLNAAGTGLVYSTYLGGTDEVDRAWGIDVDNAGNAYVAGDTKSYNFPTVNAPQPNYGGGLSDAFAARLNATGTALLYSTFLGGNLSDEARGIAVSANGNAYVTGYSSSFDFPTTANAVQPVNGGGLENHDDAFIVKITNTGTSVSTLTLNPSKVTGGNSAQGTITLSGPAPAGGAAVGLTSSDTSKATVPDSVTVPQGESTASFLITTFPASADASVNISATYGGITKTAALQLTDNIYPAVSITSPEDGITFPISEQLAVAVNATDSDGTITGVSLWEADPDGRNPVFFAEDTSAPYTFNVFRNEPMTRSYFAVATDNRGAAVRSSHITVKYNDPEAAMTISGRVLHEQYGAPMSNVTMRLRLAFQPYATIQTDADGHFSFTNLSRSGSYELTPTKAGYQFYPPAVSWEGLPEDATWDFIAAGGPAPGPAPTPTPGAPTPAWDAFYNGPQNLYDLNSKVAVDNQGNVYVTGSSYGSGSDEDIVTVKYDANGVEKWAKRFNGPGNYKDIPTDIRVDAAGNAYVVGTSYKALGDTDFDFATLKYDTAGNLSWVKYYDSARHMDDRPQSMGIDSAGNVYITGMTREGPLPDHPYGGYATVKYDTDGNEKWVRYFKGFGLGAMPADLQVDGAGNVVVTGEVELYNGGSSQDIYTIKYNTNGDELWTAQFDSEQNPMIDEDAAHSLALDQQGNIYIAGRNWKTERPGILLLKYTGDGTLEWQRNVGGDDDSAEKIVVDGSGNAYITGYKYYEGGTGHTDVLTIKVDTEGVEQWWRTYDGPGSNRADAGVLMVLDNAGNLYVGAQSQGFNFSTDLTAIKYLPDGTEAWVYRYDNGNLESDGLTGMTIDGSKNLYLTGGSQITGHASDISTVKLLPATVETGNAPPSAAMVNPPAEAVFIPGSNITLEANASTSSGQITKVEFYAGTTLVGTDKTAPYNVTWNNVEQNHYKLTARVTNSLGSMKSSNLVPITVGSPAATHSIRGRVLNGSAGVGGVSISLTGSQALTKVTDSNGNYSFTNLPAGGNYTVKPTTAGYTYAPLTYSYANLSADQTSQNFAATQRGQTISGAVKLGTAGLSGVSMTLTSQSPAGFAPRTVLTASDGTYSFSNLPSGRNYQLTATKTNHNFTPASKTYTNLIANKVNQNFTATLKVYTLSGKVNVGALGLSGVTMTLTSPTPAGFAPRTVTTAANGTYSFTNLPAGRTYRLTPTKDGYIIKNSANAAQAYRSYSNLNVNQTEQNFTATQKLYTISGTVKLGAVGLSGVTMKLTSPTPGGFAPRTVTTAANGTYSFTNVPAGRNYTLTPTKTDYVIKNSANAAQAFRSFTNLSANQLNQSFTATQKTAGMAEQAEQPFEVSADTSILKQYFNLLRLIGG
jgi:hypothetical protein